MLSKRTQVIFMNVPSQSIFRMHIVCEYHAVNIDLVLIFCNYFQKAYLFSGILFTVSSKWYELIMVLLN